MTERQQLLELLRQQSYEQRDVVLSSGRRSNFYFDGKQTTLHPYGALWVGRACYQALERFSEPVQAVGGPTLGADPMATATAMVSALEGKPIPAFIIRKEAKGYGTGQWLEGRKNVPPKARVVILEDVVTTGGSSMKAVTKAQEAELQVLGVLALVDRQEGAREYLQEQGVTLESLFTKEEVVGQ